MTDFGALIHGGMIEDDAQATLRKWMRTYIGAAEEKFGYQPEQLPDIRGWDITSDVDIEKWPETQIPALVLISPGLARDPEPGDGAHNATWDLRVALLVSASTEQAVHKLARVFAAVTRQCLLQQLQRESDLPVVNVWWTDERYDTLASDRRRTLAAALLAFNVELGQVVTLDDGPIVPDPLPDPPGDSERPDYPPPPPAEHITVTVDAQEG